MARGCNRGWCDAFLSLRLVAVELSQPPTIALPGYVATSCPGFTYLLYKMEGFLLRFAITRTSCCRQPAAQRLTIGTQRESTTHPASPKGWAAEPGQANGALQRLTAQKSRRRRRSHREARGRCRGRRRLASPRNARLLHIQASALSLASPGMRPCGDPAILQPDKSQQYSTRRRISIQPGRCNHRCGG